MVISLERTRSPEGYTPAYRVRLDSNGLVDYVGEFDVDITGRQSTHVQPMELRNLVTYADDIHFFELQDHYFELCTDIPTTIVSIQIGGRIKRVSNDYAGCEGRKDGPQVDLARLAEKIDMAAGTARWIKCDSKCLLELIKDGMNIDEQSSISGESALLIAIRKKDRPKVLSLLNAGANVNLGDNQGMTPLMWATANQQAGIVRVLLRRGADVNAKDSKGFTAAQMTEDVDILKLLAPHAKQRATRLATPSPR